jgi:hypothetical protein
MARDSRRPRQGAAITVTPQPKKWRKPCPLLGDRVEGQACGGTLCRCTLDDTLCNTIRPCPQSKRCCQTCQYHPDAPKLPEGLKILITGGIGDAIAVESVMTPEERDSLTTIYYACIGAEPIMELFKALPNFPRLKNHIVLSNNKTYYTLKAVEDAHHPLPEVHDWSISAIFPSNRTYTGSSFLTYRLSDAGATPPTPYYIIVPSSCWGTWEGRSFNDYDWASTLAILERENATGIVLTRHKANSPVHPRIINPATPRSITQAVELIKAAQGYIGIDSWVSVVASKVFPVNRLRVKSVNDHLGVYSYRYYAPRTEFGFVKEAIEA